MNRLIKYFLGLIFLLSFISAEAKNPPSKGNGREIQRETSGLREQCQKANAQIDMEINNVRAKLLTGGDLWWDGSDGKYIVPKPVPGSDVAEVSSLFAGGVWIGGLDKGGNLKIAASTFPNSTEVDYFTGPLDPETGETELQICEDWDRFFNVKGKEIELHRINFINSEGNYDCSTIPDGVKYWPGKGNPFFTDKYDFALPNTSQALGAFHDEDQDGIYDPCKGDYPIIEIRGCDDPIYPDDMFFWVYNDRGANHTETFGKPIQMEVQVQSFAFVSNDEINDMTFYRYKLINRAKEDISETYFAMWIDPDLGCPFDDYIGCDTSKVERINRVTGETDLVGRDLMYVYNEDEVDGNTGPNCGDIPSYEFDVPILGIDYFRGPKRPYTWKTVDGEEVLLPTELGESSDTTLEIGMSSFVYYNSGGGTLPQPTLDPETDEQYYNYLLGKWREGTPFTTGGTGYNIGSTDTTKYAMPGNPSKDNEWSMCSEDAAPGDRRTLQVTGPLLLEPGAKNELIIGAVWVPHIDYPCPDLNSLLYADGLAQALFDNCFERVEGPDAPDMCGVELDQELIIVLTNDDSELNNNAGENYTEVDIFSDQIIPGDSLYTFEGYKIYQVSDQNVSPSELDDIDRALLVRQVDLKNGISKIYNWSSLSNPNGPNEIWTYTEMVDGADEGLSHTFQIKTDAFASGDNTLINHKKYHFMVLAYAHNKLPDFDPLNPQDGQRKPYIEGSDNIKVLTLTPRPIVYENLNASYGDGPEITRLSGEGVGNNVIEMREDMYDIILSGDSDGKVIYQGGKGPFNVKIYDPLNVKDGRYRLELVGDYNDSGNNCEFENEFTYWELTNLDTDEVLVSDRSIDGFNEQILGDFGFAIEFGQAPDVGTDPTNGENGTLGEEIVYADEEGVQWFNGLVDGPTGTIFDYIENDIMSSNYAFDPNGDLSTNGAGFFTPFVMNKFKPAQGDNFWFTPGFVKNQFAVNPYSGIELLNNVDIVMTSDKSKWSRCVVVERSDDRYTTESNKVNVGVAGNFWLRDSDSVDKNGETDGDGKGMSYFPGYAIDVETGRRLNIFFGENSAYNSNYIEDLQDSLPIGEDMLFNPSSQLIAGTENTTWTFMVGGQHNIYVTRQTYDACAEIRSSLEPHSTSSISKALGLITWQAVPMLPEGVKMNSIEDGLIPTDVTVKLRVSNPYNRERIYELGNRNCEVLEDNPAYEFELSGVSATDLASDEYEGALENVNVVPNPYYGFSAYEFTQYSTTVKITNVPAKATVTIYSLEGKFIKQFKRDEKELACGTSSNRGVPTMQITPDIEWNLKNSSGIPVSSGVYLIHINAPDLQEERTIKWFGVSRKFDPSGL